MDTIEGPATALSSLSLSQPKSALIMSSPSPLVNHKPPFVSSLDDLIQQIHSAFDGDHVDVDHVTEIMESYKSNPADWKRFAKWDRYKYTRNLVDEGNGKFNLMMLCWGPSQVSCIHDHTDAHCFMKMLSGTLEETRYDWPKEGSAEGQREGFCEEDGGVGEEEGMKPVGRTALKTNGVCYINDSLGLHRVSNPSDSEGAVSLHLYCPPFSSCQMFDERTGKRTRCPVTFYSKFGHKVKHCKK